MADVEHEDVEQKPAKAPKVKVPRLPKPAGGGGGGNAATIIGWALALAALVAVFLLFKQVSALKQAIGEAEGPTPRGAQEAGAEGATEAVSIDDWQAEAQEVVYELGKFTANTADGQHAQMEIALCVESYYRQQEWEAYSAQMMQYEELMKAYLEQQSGKHEEGKKGKTEDAGLAPPDASEQQGVINASYPQVVPAQHGKKAEEVKPLEPPVEPIRPLTRMEREIMKQEAKIRDTIIEQINLKSAAELTSAEGRVMFKKAMIDALNNALPRHVGTVIDIYFRDLVTT